MRPATNEDVACQPAMRCLFLFLRTSRAVKETQKSSGEAETGCILFGNTTLRHLINLSFTYSRFKVSDYKLYKRLYKGARSLSASLMII